MFQLLNYIRSNLELSHEAENRIVSIIKEREAKKGTHLLKVGETNDKQYFVVEGCLRSYCTDNKGREHTIQFAVKDWWISDYMTLYSGEPSMLTIEAVKTTQFIEIKVDDLEQLYSDFPEFESLLRKNLERRLASLQRRVLYNLMLPAHEKYEAFLKEYASIEQHVPNYQIASYLGITPESLSRIRLERAKIK